MHVLFDHCQYGGEREKTTRLVHSIPEFQRLESFCDGSHEHQAWGLQHGVWTTSLETAYPLELCKTMADYFKRQLLFLGVVNVPSSLGDSNAGNAIHLAQASIGKQPRGKKLPPLVSEFRQVIELVTPLAVNLPTKISLEWFIPANCRATPSLVFLPPGVLRRQWHGGVRACDEGVQACEDGVAFHGSEHSFSSQTGSVVQEVLYIVGIPCSPEEFISKAASVEHPKNLVSGLPDELKHAILRNAELSEDELGRERTATMRRWLQLAVDLSNEEKVLREEMSDVRRGILKGKRLVLLSHLLQEMHDSKIAAEIGQGFSLTGKIPSSGVYKRKRKYAVLAEEDLVECSEKTNLGILAGTGSCGDAEADRELYRVTREELDRGWIHGPLPQTVLGPGSSVTQRFPVVQGRKIRPIDDFTASLINLTNSSQESVGLHGAEIIAASLVQWFSSCHALGVVDTDLKVQSWDLWKAYKQLCLSDAARERTFMAIWNPLDECVELYRHCALPFGGRASVNAFCRASRSLWVLGTVQLSFFWTNYFDDYVIFSRPASSRHCSSMAGMFFKVMGWLVSEDKLEDFGPEAKALGFLFSRAGNSLCCWWIPL